MPGWYPDPAGTPNRFRYWDGRAWSPDTTADPTDPAPTPAASDPSVPGAGGPSRGGGRRLGPWIVALVALVVLALLGVLIIRAVVGDRSVVDDGPLPTPTVSGWDDSSPTEPASPTPSDPPPSPAPTATPTRTPTPTPTEEQPLQPCPEGQPTARQEHPSDGRVHGGDLSFPEVAGWRASSGLAFSWAYDVGEQTKTLEPQWQANLAVGALFTGDGFDEPRRSAELVMQCVITSGLYSGFSDRTDLWSQAMTVDGRTAWSIRSEIRVDSPDVQAEGDTVEVIIVDTGSPESLSMFLGAVSIGDKPLTRTLDSTIKGLRVG